MSILLGLVIGLLSAVISKRMTSIKGHVVKEVFLIILIGYLSYIIGEALELSAIMSLFVCGVTMSHYTFHNVSKEAQAGSVVSINTLGHATEAFLFIYLGLGIFTIDQETFQLSATLYIVIGSLFAWAFSVLIPIGIYAAIKKFQISINFKQLCIIWFSGLIWGAIAFALSLTIQENFAPHWEQLISITLITVLMTTIVLGGLMGAFAKLIGLKMENPNDIHS